MDVGGCGLFEFNVPAYALMYWEYPRKSYHDSRHFLRE